MYPSLFDQSLAKKNKKISKKIKKTSYNRKKKDK